MSRAEALERYRELPLPDTTEEHWRFTDLRGFDPDSFGQGQGTVPGTAPARTIVDLDVANDRMVIKVTIRAHGTMPVLVIPDADMDNLIDYIQSLRTPR